MRAIEEARQLDDGARVLKSQVVLDVGIKLREQHLAISGLGRGARAILAAATHVVLLADLHLHVDAVSLFRADLEHHVLLGLEEDLLGVVRERYEHVFVEGEAATALTLEEPVLNEVLMQEQTMFAVLSVLILDDGCRLQLKRERCPGKLGLIDNELGGRRGRHVKDDQLVRANSQDDIDVQLVL